ncbi:MAG: hypothetical protein Q9157_000726 [Trypethelium eluteriae]
MDADGKFESGTLVQDLSVEYRDDVLQETGKYGTEADRRDMRRINKRQELPDERKGSGGWCIRYARPN